MNPSSRDDRRYLDPKVLARISGLELRARLIVEGFFSGMHRSPHRGLSVEFADHRAYTQGDDLRHIDWKVYGKSDRYFIKEYEQETNLRLLIVVDRSESMGYRSSDELMTKHDYAASLAAAMAYLTLRQQDAVGLALFEDRVVEYIRPSNSGHHWRTIVQELSRPPGKAKTSVGRVLDEVAERVQQRMLIVLISDLFDDADSVLKGFRHIRYRHHELVVWNLWDPAEITFPYTGPTLFEGLEESGRLLTEPHALRDRYLAETERFRTLVRLGCGRMHVDYAFFDTSTSLDVALSDYLATRSARLRNRSSRVLGRG